MTRRLRVAIATPQEPEDVEHLARLEPRLDIDFLPELMPPADVTTAGIGTGRLRRTPEQQAQFDAMLDAAEAFLGVPDGSGRALHRAVTSNPGLRWVHTIPAGGGQQVRAAKLDRVDLDRVIFTTSAGVHAEPLAEFALFGVLAGAKQLPWLLETKAAREWGAPRQFGMLQDRVVVVVGLGSIGRAVARKLAGLGCRVVGVHRRDVEAEGVERIVAVERMAEAFAQADAVVLALPSTDATEGLVDATAIGALKPGATFVNVGRGSTVDEDALLAAARDGRIGTAMLDVTRVEPLPSDHPLWAEPNVFIAHHTAARTDRERRMIVEVFADNARRLLDGEPLRNVVNTIEFY